MNAVFSEIEAILRQYRKVAIVGLSPCPDRASHMVAVYLMQHGYQVTPVNPKEASILGQECYSSLKEVPGDIEIVNIFRSSAAVPPIVEEAIERRAKVIWMQLGVVNEAAAKQARDAGLTVVMDRCIKIDDARYRSRQS